MMTREDNDPQIDKKQFCCIYILVLSHICDANLTISYPL